MKLYCKVALKMDGSSESLVKHIIKTFIMKIPSGITVSKFKKMLQLNEMDKYVATC